MSAKQALERHHAKELLRRAVSARSRVLEEIRVGEIIFFYRDYPTGKAQKAQCARGKFLGPALVIGHQGGNVWAAYAGRCYLVAQEHVRGLAPDEACATRPIVQEKLQAVREAQRARDYVDLSAQDPSAEELARAAALPAADGHLPGGVPAQELLPEHPVERGEADPDAPPEEAARR